ncbi:MAG: hypothetical protein AABX99_01120 [Nanoarchaeota archaeon]
MVQKKYYPITLYMNAKFVEDYLNPFIKIIVQDDKIPKDGIKFNIEKGKGAIIESISPAIRSLIKYYVDCRKAKMLKEPKNEKA